MKKIAILTCLEACQVCTGAGCLKAWNEKSHGFARYAGQNVQLVAFLHCNGCRDKLQMPDRDPKTDPGMQEKLDRLVQEGVEVVHTGICTFLDCGHGEKCPVIAEITEELKARGIAHVEGTH